ncbi:MAG TPA: cyclic nucleotide-binding domain-containing protein [Gammaproteobacteria bacterium]|nr:cyclic nucleotide-binding domain-containing protein [Gammaproteobacteria bacterium]
MRETIFLIYTSGKRPVNRGAVAPPTWKFTMQTLKGSRVMTQLGLDYIRQCSTFGALSDDGIRYLFKEGRVLQLEKGETLFQLDDPGNRFYIILKGSFRFYKHHHDKCTYIRDHVFGEELGFIAMIALHNRRGSAHAAEASIVLEISSALFNRLQKSWPKDFGLLLLNLSRGMARRIRELNNMLVERDFDS